MRYIRTKDEIIVDTTKYKNVVERTFNNKVVAIDLNHWGKDNDKYPTWIDVEDIIKQANTIEELCDAFVIINNEDEMEVIRNFKYAKDSCVYDELFGAIWTSKGLIYVAKMGDKGELELL